jgi:uracil-DNA glycosylase
MDSRSLISSAGLSLLRAFLCASALIGAAGLVKTRRMDAGANSLLAQQVAGALAWYREAGIDCGFTDVPRRWLAPVVSEAGTPTAATSAPVPAPPPPPERDRANWPADLAAFVDWWLHEPWLDGGRTGGRVPPRGITGARLMLLVPEPEIQDEDVLLSGPQGRLVAGMLAAMGIEPGEAYIASALPRHTPMADWSGIASRGLGEVLMHHVGLVMPERVIAFGNNIPSLLGNDPTISAAPPTRIEVGETSIPLLAARSVEGLLVRPGWKADMWAKWLEWTR